MMHKKQCNRGMRTRVCIHCTVCEPVDYTSRWNGARYADERNSSSLRVSFVRTSMHAPNSPTTNRQRRSSSSCRIPDIHYGDNHECMRYSTFITSAYEVDDILLSEKNSARRWMRGRVKNRMPPAMDFHCPSTPLLSLSHHLVMQLSCRRRHREWLMRGDR
jgi:hypothetical protein